MPRRLVPSGVTGGSSFLTLCFLDRTLANLRAVLLDGRHPFFMSGEFRISSNTLFPMTAVRSYRCRNIYQVSLLKYKEHLVFYIKSDVFYINFDVFEGVKKFYFAPF